MKRRYKKEHKGHLSKLIIAIVLVTVVVISSIVTVMANTVPCTVVDGDKSYSFSMLSPAVTDIVAKAVSEGMTPLQENDRVHGEKGEIIIDRALTVLLTQNVGQVSLVAYKGETLGQAMDRADVAYGEKDKITPTIDTVITQNMDASIASFTPAVVWVDGVGKRVELHGGTVADALVKAGITIGEKDKVSPALDTPLTPELFIKLQLAKEITVVDGGESQSHTVLEGTVADVLAGLAITVNPLDRLTPSLESPIVADMSIQIDRVTVTQATETVSIDYNTSYIDDSTMDKGTTAVDTQGVTGSKEVTYEDTYVNGMLEDRTVLSEKILQNPVDAVVLQGTKSTTPTGPSISTGSGSNNGGATFVDYNGNVVSYSNVMSGSSTAYTAPAGAITSLGWTAQVGIVAVNPKLIPYGTKLYIASDDFVYGYAVAGDTGGALMAGDALVDVYYPTYDECAVFGRRNMNVYILS